VTLTARDLRKAFGGVRAVDGVTVELHRGDIRALIGPNGAGKTTFFNMLTGQLRPDSGEVRLGDERLTGLAPHAISRRGLGRTFQITATFGSLTVLENVQVARMAHVGRSRELVIAAARVEVERSRELLAQVGLATHAHRPSHELPYGDLKKLELAVALAGDPAILLLDEPTAGMAPAERGELMRLIGAIARERTLAVLFTEHDMDVVFATAKRVTVMHQGRVIADGPPDDVRADSTVQRVYLGEG
jgi:branched-chain amino acid transport system ATP-binding protein